MGGAKITHLDVSNTKMQAKAGLFIGEALLENPDYAVAKIIFKNVRLEENGLYRMIEAANANRHITQLHVGIISDYGLRTLGDLLTHNKSLLKIQFQEGKSFT